MDAKQTFDELRILAKLKCDADVKLARTRHKERLAIIDQLENDLASVATDGPPPARRRRGDLKALIHDVAPTDAPFTIDDIHARLAETPNPPNIGSLRNSIRRMHRRGELKQIANKRNRLLKLYAWPDVECGEAITPVAALIYEVLAESNAAMRPVEICVALIEAGKALEGDPTESVGLVMRTLRDYPERFRENEDGYWKAKKA